MTRWVPTKREEKYGVGELRAPHSAPGRPDLPAARAPEGRRGRAGRGGLAGGRAGAPEPVAAGPARVPGAPSGARASGAGDSRGRAVSLPEASPFFPATQLPGGHPVAKPSTLPGRPSSNPILPAAEAFGWAGRAAPGSLFCRVFLLFG